MIHFSLKLKSKTQLHTSQTLNFIFSVSEFIATFDTVMAVVRYPDDLLNIILI